MQFHDDAGLTLPKALAPYEVVVVPTNMDQPAVVEAAERIYRDLSERGAEVVLDDREVSAGVKFADADLIGFPVQVVVGKRGVVPAPGGVPRQAGGERHDAGARLPGGLRFRRRFDDQGG